MRPVLFRIDPETVHNRMLRVGRALGTQRFFRRIAKSLFTYQHPSLELTVAGIHFKNPIGLAADFDKNGVLMNIIGEMGFGFAEIGSITARASLGNARPRLWRLPHDKAIAVHYGLANKGTDTIMHTVQNARPSVPIGISVAKTNDATIFGAAAVEDYAYSVSRFEPYGSYLTINVSCPNTADGREFCEVDNLSLLLEQLKKIKITKPVFIKLKPDLSRDALDDILSLCASYAWITGFIISNLTHNYNLLATDKQTLVARGVRGGLSGKAVQKLSNELLSYAYQKSGKRFIFIGCGGVFSAQDAYEKIKRGASLVQLITGMIYQGPQLIREINKGLVDLMHADGFKTIAEAVGSKYRT